MKKLKELVIKANELIEMPVDFNLMQLKLFAKIVVSIRDNPNEDYYSFSVKKLLQDFSLADSNYTHLKNATKGLIRPVVIKGEGDVEKQKAFFTDVDYDSKGTVHFRIHKDLKPLVLDLEKNYTKYYFSNIARLKSAYSIRIYELLKQYEYKNERVLSIDEIRRLLKIEDDKYLKYSNFKEKVIIVASKELKEKTDIYFEFEEIKEWKKVVSIKFTIFSNSQNITGIQNGIEFIPSENIKDTPNPLEELQIFKILVKEYKVSNKSALKIVESYSEERIKNNIEYALKEQKIGNVSKTFTGYLIEAIKQDYASAIPLFELDAKNNLEKARNHKALEEERDALITKLSLAFSKVEKKKYVNSLSPEEQEELINEILEESKLDLHSVKMLKDKGLNSPVAGVGIIRRIPDFEKRREEFISQKLREAGL